MPESGENTISENICEVCIILFSALLSAPITFITNVGQPVVAWKAKRRAKQFLPHCSTCYCSLSSLLQGLGNNCERLWCLYYYYYYYHLRSCCIWTVAVRYQCSDKLQYENQSEHTKQTSQRVKNRILKGDGGMPPSCLWKLHPCLWVQKNRNGNLATKKTLVAPCGRNVPEDRSHLWAIKWHSALSCR